MPVKGRQSVAAPRSQKDSFPVNLYLAATVAVVPVVAAAVLGSIATTPNVDSWYANLERPSFNPPNWIFAPVWTLLYAMMAYAFFRILTSDANAWTGAAMALFFIQIALNVAWSWAFFAGHSPRAGLLVIIPLWCAIALTAIAFWQVDRWASVLIWPYLVWVSFAVVLNASIDRLNPE